MINIQKTAYLFLLLLVIALATSPAFALGQANRNLLLIGVMSISPMLIIFFNYVAWLPGGTNNTYLLIGLASILGGIVTATQYR